jgi:hypothetical protein
MWQQRAVGHSLLPIPSRVFVLATHHLLFRPDTMQTGTTVRPVGRCQRKFASGSL